MGNDGRGDLNNRFKRIITSLKGHISLIEDPFYNLKATRVKLDICHYIIDSDEFKDFDIEDKVACILAIWAEHTGYLYTKVGYLKVSESIIRHLFYQYRVMPSLAEKVSELLLSHLPTDKKRVFLDSIELAYLCTDLWEDRRKWMNAQKETDRAAILQEFDHWYSNCMLIRPDGLRTEAGRVFYEESHPIFCEYIKRCSFLEQADLVFK